MNQRINLTTGTSRALRIALAFFAAFVLTSIVPVSIHNWHSGDACPQLGPVPACYLVSVCYLAIAVASAGWRLHLTGLFFVGIAPIIGLALTGTVLEMSGRPTCPVSENEVPLCFYSLAAGIGMLAIFCLIMALERGRARSGHDIDGPAP